MSSVTTERFYKSLFCKFFCINLSQVVLRWFYTEQFFCSTIWVTLICLISHFIQIWKDRTHPIFWESYHPHFNAESCHNFAIYMFRLIKSYKSFHVRPPLEILRNSSKPFSEAATGGVHKKFFLNIWRYSQESNCVGVSFLIKLQAISPVTLLKHGLKRDSNTDISCDYREIYNNT